MVSLYVVHMQCSMYPESKMITCAKEPCLVHESPVVNDDVCKGTLFNVIEFLLQVKKLCLG